MIEIEGPDGVIYEFPAGTDDATIKQAMGKVYGEPKAEPSMADALWQRSGAFVEEADRKEARAASWLNRAGESMTLGVVGDEAAAAADALIGRGTYDDRLAAYRKQEQDLGAAGRLSADMAGALVPGLGMAGMIGRAASVPGRIGMGALSGGLSGATYGFAEGEGGFENRRDNAGMQGIVGAALGGAIPAIGAGVRSIAQGRAARDAIKSAAKGAPTTDELRAVGNALYKQVDDAGVQIKPQSFDTARAEILDYLRGTTGYDELPGAGSLTPNTARVMGIMDEAGGRMAKEPTAALPFRSLDQMRRQAGAAAGNVTNKTDAAAGRAVIEKLDDFVQKLGPDDVVGGDPEALKSAITKAREVWQRMSKSQLIDDAMERSENYLSGSASGVRNQFKNILQNKKLARQFTPAEKAALRQVTHGSTLDQLVNLAGGGLAQLGTIGAGFGMGGVPGAMAGAGLAAGSRKLAEALTMRNAEIARAAIASGSLGRDAVAQALAIAGKQSERLTNAGLLAALLAGQQATP